MPNALAYLVLFGWPLVAMILFRRLPLPHAVCWTIIAGYLLIPTQPVVNLPLLPAFEKSFMLALACAVMAMITVRQAGMKEESVEAPHLILKGWIPKSLWAQIALAALLVGGFLTVFDNQSALVYESRRLPALSIYDGFSMGLTLLALILPFFIGRKYLGDPRSHIVLLGVLCMAGFLYAFPTLWEARMSPQLNSTIYGYFPHSWRQHLRGGGYRPLVFLRHGLQLGLFLSMAFIATLALTRVTPPGRRKIFLGGAAIWIMIALVLSKNTGAFLIAVVCAPVVALLGYRLQLLMAAVIAVMVLTYPVLRGSGILTAESITGTLASFDVPRLDSLGFRLENEEILLDKANKKPIFGWGGWGRSRVFGDEGGDNSTTDGMWIIVLGLGGWFRYAAQFGLLTIPILLLAFRRRGENMSMATSALCVVLAANLVDLLPNTGLTPITWLIAGALAGRLEVTREMMMARSSESPGVDTSQQQWRYSRSRARPSHNGGSDMPAYTRFGQGNR